MEHSVITLRIDFGYAELGIDLDEVWQVAFDNKSKQHGLETMSADGLKNNQ